MNNDYLLLSIILLSILIYFYVQNSSNTEYYAPGMICYYATENDRRRQRIQRNFIIPKPKGGKCEYHTDCESIHCHPNKNICIDSGCVSEKPENKK